MEMLFKNKMLNFFCFSVNAHGSQTRNGRKKKMLTIVRILKLIKYFINKIINLINFYIIL